MALALHLIGKLRTIRNELVVTIGGAHVDYWDNATPAAVLSIGTFVPLDAASAD